MPKYIHIWQNSAERFEKIWFDEPWHHLFIYLSIYLSMFSVLTIHKLPGHKKKVIFQKQTFNSPSFREHVKKLASLRTRPLRGGGVDPPVAKKCKLYKNIENIQNHPSQAFLVSKTYIFIYVKKTCITLLCLLKVWLFLKRS